MGARWNQAALVVVAAVAMLAAWGCEEGGTNGPVVKEPKADNGGLLVVSPNGGECYEIGSILEIELGYAKEEEDAVAGLTGVVDLYTGDRKVQNQILAEVDYVIESKWNWAIPDSIWELDAFGANTGNFIPFPEGEDYRLRAGDYGDVYEKVDFSDAPFAIRQSCP